ncbi:MAG: hypothetical protein ACYC3K_07560, partial [Candidatus Nanopelagicales bacterium]
MTTNQAAADPALTAAWTALTGLAGALEGTTIRALCEADPQRVESLAFTAAGVTLDATRQRVTPDVVAA